MNVKRYVKEKWKKLKVVFVTLAVKLLIADTRRRIRRLEKHRVARSEDNERGEV